MIPKGAPNLDAALEFIKFATSTEPLAKAAEWISYGPPRKSSGRWSACTRTARPRWRRTCRPPRPTSTNALLLVLRVLGRPRHRAERALQRLARRQLSRTTLPGGDPPPAPLAGAIMAQVDLSGREPQAAAPHRGRHAAEGSPGARLAPARSGGRSRSCCRCSLFVLVTFVAADRADALPLGRQPRLLREHAEPRRLVRGQSAGHRARRGRLRRAGRRPAASPPRRAPSASSAPGSTTRSRAPARCSPRPVAAPTSSSRRSARRMLELDADWGRPGALVRDARRRRGAHRRTSTSPPLDRKVAADGRHRPRRPGAAHLPAAVLAHHVPLGA